MKPVDPEVSFQVCVKDLDRACTFYEAVFETLARSEGEGEERILHLRPSSRRWEIVCVTWESARRGAPHLFSGKPPEASFPATSLRIHVADVDAAFARALASGGLAVDEPAPGSDGRRIGRLRDPDGNLVTLLARRKRS